MNLSQQKLEIAGELGRSAGYAFEDIILDEINNHTNIGNLIIDYVLQKENIINTQHLIIEAVKTPKLVDDALGRRKVPPKADILLIIRAFNKNILKEIGVSIKSSPANIQVQITNIDSFKNVVEYYGLEFSNQLYRSLCKFCGWGEYKPNEKEKKNLKQGHRDRWLYDELLPDEQKSIKDFFTLYEIDIIDIVLRKGSSQPKYFADYYIVNKVAYSSTQIVDICIKDMSTVIKDAAIGFAATPQGSFHIGKITAQMKGSGKGKAYHGFQLNKKGC